MGTQSQEVERESLIPFNSQPALPLGLFLSLRPTSLSYRVKGKQVADGL